MKKNYVFLLLIAILSAFVIIVATATSFVDVPEDAYYAEAAERMAEKGILSGYGDGYFYGNDLLTRAQFAALACKILGKVNEATALVGETVFADVPETHWSTGYVNYAVANKIINGDGDGNFRPDDSVKYEEALKVIVCIIEPDNNITIDPSDWSKNFISEAKKLGLTDNLVGEKGEFIKRSDIAVLADNAVTAIENTAEETEKVSTTVKPSKPTEPVETTIPAETTAPEEPETTTSEVTTAEQYNPLKPSGGNSDDLGENTLGPNDTPFAD